MKGNRQKTTQTNDIARKKQQKNTENSVSFSILLIWQLKQCDITKNKNDFIS